MENIKQQAVNLLNFPTDIAGLKKKKKAAGKCTHATHMKSAPNHIRRGEGIIADERKNPVKVTFLGIGMKVSEQFPPPITEC